MKPIRLKIKGINSYLEEQTIDFEELISRGLFGIFGPTGSGKSSILDAITLALFDRISRETEKKNREFINKETDSASVFFEFELGLEKGQSHYVVERLYKQTETVACRAVSARFYERKSNGETVILADKPSEVTKEVIGRLGIGYDDFSRSVVLPQGKFSEFLTLVNIQRRSMLERIFKLEKYGQSLTDRIRIHFNREKGFLKNLESKLEIYSDMTEERMEAEKNRLKQRRQEKETADSLWEKENQLWRQKQEIWNLTMEKQQYIQQEKELEERKEEIEQKQGILNWGRKAAEAFPFLLAWEEASEKLEKSRTQEKQMNQAWEMAEKAASQASQNYKQAYERKEKQFASLLQEEEKLKQAVLMIQEMKKVEEERKVLISQYQKENKIKNELQIKWNDILKERTEKNKELEQISIEKEKTEISGDDRKKVDSGAEIESKILNSVEQIKEQEEKLNFIRKKIKEGQKQKEQIIQSLQKKQQEKQNLKSAMDQLSLEMVPGEVLAEAAAKTAQFHTRRQEAQEKEKQFLEREKQWKEICQKILKEQERIAEKEALLNKKWEEQKQIADALRQEEQRNLAGILAKKLISGEACPVCGSLHHPNPAVFVEEKDGRKKYEELEKQEQEQKKEQLLLAEEKLELSRMELQAEQWKEECSKLRLFLKEGSASVWKQKEEQEEEKRKKLAQQAEQYEKKRKNLEASKQLLQEEMAKIQADQTGIEVEQKNKQDREKELLEEIKKINQTKMELEMQRKQLLQEYPLISDFSQEQERIRQQDEKRKKLEEQERESRKQIEKLDIEKEKISDGLKEAEGRILVIITQGSEKKTAIEERKKKLEELTKGENPSIRLEEIQKITSEIVKNEEEMRKELESAEQQRQKAAQEKSSIEKERETYEKIEQERKKEQKKKEQELGFFQTEEIRKRMLDEREMEQIEETCKEYTKKKEETQANIQRLQQKTKGISITKEEALEAEQQAKEAFRKKEEATSQLAVQIEMVRTIEQKCTERLELEKEAQKHQHEVAILADLADLIKGNRFVEYIATQQLEYITKEASRWLKQITKGRYALELSGSDFIMRDDFNGGVRRKPSTLSGGETFLTSFSLALALSSKIQMKNHAPLQFFFLDEGFGTLDSQLLDIVMDALENLHQENFSVGIITHVKELRNRIPRKLIVKPADQGLHGTRIYME